MAHAELTTRILPAGDEAGWDRFVAGSNNGTLFHRLTFLGYHPAGRFRFRHLEVLRGGELVAVVPGGVDADGLYRSPLGASVGGVVLRTGTRTHDAAEIVRAIKDASVEEGWGGVAMTLAPPAWHVEPNELLEFALSHSGFVLARRWLTYMIPLGGGDATKRFSKGTRAAARAARRDGDISVREGGADLLPLFDPLFEATYKRLQTSPTHSRAEIADLMERCPESLRIWVASSGGEPIVAVLLFILNAQACTTFYICSRETDDRSRGSAVLFATMADALAERGYRYLDLGPSAGPDGMNAGVISFKEHLGAVGMCRDEYRWDRTS